ncbi:MAG TPA: hypothetical protein VER03_00185 [Bryobacteraceae bacterium]|nr:hypothetical protein [Bryobacteraceae bacterium]
MRGICVLLLAVCSLPPVLRAQSEATHDIPRDVLLLARVRAHMSDLLLRLPNYTCLLNIERTGRSATGRMQLLDVVRIEVALVEGNELFAWPGSKNFQDTKIVDMVKGGAIGSGNFALHAKSVFQSAAPRFTFAGDWTMNDGRQALRWDYVVPLAMSGYTLRSPPHQATVGYHGSFWVDAKTLQVLRLQVHADDIPAQLGIASAADTIDYQRVDLGGEDFLLPAKAELRMAARDGQENINLTTFTGCRQYAGESTISFEDADATKQSGVKQPERTLHVPAGLTLRAALETPITSGVSAVGDPVTAILKKEVKLGSGLVAPKGALVHGRVIALRRYTQPNGWIVGFDFFELEWENFRARVRAELADAPAAQVALNTLGSIRAPLVKTDEQGAFFVQGDKLTFRRGLPLEFRTQPVQTEENQ